jgi:hypothetical protein
MANVLICEPAMTLRVLLGYELERLGHYVLGEGASEELVDIALVELADAWSLERARALRSANPAVSLILFCDEEPSAETQALDPRVVHLVKPYSLATLERAIAIACALSPWRRGSSS